MTVVDPARPAACPTRTWARTSGLAAVVGTVTAAVVVHAYYNDPWRPLAHTLGIWAVLGAALAWRRPLRLAVTAASTFLATAVVAYYVGVKVGHDIRWAGSGSTMGVDWDTAGLWVLFAVPAGVVLGWIGASAGRRDRCGPLASAALLGLVLGDAARRWVTWGADVAVAVDLLAAVCVVVVATRTNRQPVATLAWTVLTAVAGLVLVSGPDLVEQLLVSGS